MEFKNNIDIKFPILLYEKKQAINKTVIKLDLSDVEYIKKKLMSINITYKNGKRNDTLNIRCKSLEEANELYNRLQKLMVFAQEYRYANENERNRIINKINFIESCY